MIENIVEIGVFVFPFLAFSLIPPIILSMVEVISYVSGITTFESTKKKKIWVGTERRTREGTREREHTVDVSCDSYNGMEEE